MRPSTTLATARALRWREDFQAFSDQDPSYAPAYLRRWCSGAQRSRLPPITDSLVQAAKARARGYRNKNKMITIVYLTAAKLQLPTLTNPTPAYMSSR